ncbi:Acyl-CoA reductase (LuxC) [Paenimyroides aquimaris]|uniref:Acyl-CoA reductase (LuxC) n=1 Tax=Paenimyroides marinum TaxID=1159016 RepID=A0A1H6MG81_9FLAO|nr:acyl-CoA reductase [Paenimyroides aquimaris]SEH96658.1 Acyl-CoA reductase (LuxC) [Paenimyroides aquimaris]
MILEDKKKAFIQLGLFLEQFTAQPYQQNNSVLFNDLFFDKMERLMDQLHESNSWFKRPQLEFAFKSWSNALTQENLDKWLAPYDLSNEKLKTIGLILAGNIPMVGFHDVLSVLISGNKALIKLSSNDELLIPLVLDYLGTIEAELKNRYKITKEKLGNFDAVIATGSNNTARYFDYYFGKHPNIIRKNRNSVAVLNGSESKEDLLALGEDIFRYYGLGCRNVSKLFVPKGYNFDAFFESMFVFKDLINDEKYTNNYDYNKAVYLMSNFNILDNGFLTIKEDTSYASPISSVFYEYYEDLETLKNKINSDNEKIQCIVSNQLIENSVPFGSTQNPALWDYADDVDTMKFLLSL